MAEMRERDELVKWAGGQSEDEIEACRLANNVVSIDELSTGYVSDDF